MSVYFCSIEGVSLCSLVRKRLDQQQRLLEEDRKRRQFEEQKQKLRLLSSVKPKVGSKVSPFPPP